MNNPIANALRYLSEVEVRGERNCVLLAAVFRELKPLAHPEQETTHENHQP